MDDQTAQLTYVAVNGETGIPGQARIGVKVTLPDTTLTHDMRAGVDRRRPISLARHNCSTLGERSGADLSLTMPMERLLTLSEVGIVTGEIENVTDAALDFRSGRNLRGIADGIDRLFIRPDGVKGMQHIAERIAPSGLRLGVASNRQRAQFYTGHGLGDPFEAWGGICIEPSGYLNAVNQPHFPSMVCTPALPYVQKLVLEVGG